MIKLSPRLLTVAELAGSGKSVVDVGTDHGYVPVYFAQKGLFERIAASDINGGPLESARASAREYGVFDRIAFYLSDGLRDVPGAFDTVVIAGMGGETMADILSACSWAKDARLILQPQSRVEELGAYLKSAGFVCQRALLCRDSGRCYLAFSASAGEGGFDIARALLDSRDGLLRECVEKEVIRVGRAVSGMESGSAAPEAGITLMKNKLSRLENILREVNSWQN